MNEGEVGLQVIGDEGGALRTTGVRGHDNGVSVFGDVLLNVVLDHGFPVKVVDGNIEEALVLRIVEVHGDDVIGAGACEEVGDKGTGLGNPLLVARLRLEGLDVVGVLVVVGGEARLRAVEAIGALGASDRAGTGDGI